MKNIPRSSIKHTTFALLLALGLLFLPYCTPSEPEASAQPAITKIDLVIDGTVGKAAQFGIDRLTASLKAGGCQVERQESLEAADADHVLLLGTLEGSQIVQTPKKGKSARSSGS